MYVHLKNFSIMLLMLERMSFIVSGSDNFIYLSSNRGSSIMGGVPFVSVFGIFLRYLLLFLVGSTLPKQLEKSKDYFIVSHL